jgi:NAD(P)-dependent dehydrogenase (short-subunit alcohol dehydrogenase family)
MELKGKRVVLLGGTSGIGLATARGALAQGAEVTVVSRRQSSVDGAVAALPGASGHAADLSDPDSVHALFDDLGDFDHLVFTAGEPLELMTIENLDLAKARGMFTVRFFGALSAVHAAVPHLREGGSITLTTGTASERPGPGWAVAAGVCGAMNGLTRALAVELAPIRVNAVSPGIVRSDLWRGMNEADREAMYHAVGASLPTGRIGEVEDVARAYLYCMTQAWSTGTIHAVDGGTLLV